jgi:hypothetical protein
LSQQRTCSCGRAPSHGHICQHPYQHRTWTIFGHCACMRSLWKSISESVSHSIVIKASRVLIPGPGGTHLESHGTRAKPASKSRLLPALVRTPQHYLGSSSRSANKFNQHRIRASAPFHSATSTTSTRLELMPQQKKPSPT